jgi:hypothetical protein
MIAKIAHGLAFAALGRAEFERYEPLLENIILRNAQTPDEFVGGDTYEETVSPHAVPHGTTMQGHLYSYPLGAREVPGHIMSVHKWFRKSMAASATTYAGWHLLDVASK